MFCTYPVFSAVVYSLTLLAQKEINPSVLVVEKMTSVRNRFSSSLDLFRLKPKGEHKIIGVVSL